eukprot:6209077-Pleurochrysis_carterae.AAC.3
MGVQWARRRTSSSVSPSTTEGKGSVAVRTTFHCVSRQRARAKEYGAGIVGFGMMKLRRVPRIARETRIWFRRNSGEWVRTVCDALTPNCKQRA